MISVNTHEAKTKLSKLLLKIEQKGEMVIICRHGVPVAKLLPWDNAKDPLRQHAKLKKVIFHQDPTLPLNEKDWPSTLR